MDSSWIWFIVIFIVALGIIVFMVMMWKKRCEALDKQIAYINMNTPLELREAAIRDAKISSSCTSDNDKEDLRAQRDIDVQCYKDGKIDQMCASNIRERYRLDRERRILNQQKNNTQFTFSKGTSGSNTIISF